MRAPAVYGCESDLDMGRHELMRLHPMFIVCFAVALLGGILAGGVAISATNCDPPGTFQPDHPCTVADQLNENASVTVMLGSLVLMLGGVGFQLERASTRQARQPAQPSHMGPPQAGQPWRGAN